MGITRGVVVLLVVVGCTARTSGAPAKKVEAVEAVEVEDVVPAQEVAPLEETVAAPVEETAATWLAAHPEVLAISAEPLEEHLIDEPSFWTVRITTAGGATRCVVQNEGELKSWCWAAEGSEVLDADVDDGEDDDEENDEEEQEGRSLVMRERLGGERASARWLRFPRSEWTAAPVSAAVVPEETRPSWWLRKRWVRPKSYKVAVKAAWKPFVSGPATIEFGALRGLAIRRVPASTAGLEVIELTRDGEEEIVKTVCARWQDRWRCAPARMVEIEVSREDEYNLAYGVGDRLVMQRSDLLRGGDGEFSGAGGSARLEWFAVGEALQPVASLQIGGMEWLTLRDGDYGPFYRWVKRYFHVHAARGACVAISAAEVEQCRADHGFMTTRKLKRQREAFALWPVPDALKIEAGIIKLPEDARPPAKSEIDGMDAVMASWTLTGVWRLADGELVRVSGDPAAACDR